MWSVSKIPLSPGMNSTICLEHWIKQEPKLNAGRYSERREKYSMGLIKSDNRDRAWDAALTTLSHEEHQKQHWKRGGGETVRDNSHEISETNFNEKETEPKSKSVLVESLKMSVNITKV